MCLIIVKEQGKEMPNKKILLQAWENNEDGFGLAFWRAGMEKVIIRKGAMNKKGLFQIINSLGTRQEVLDSIVVMHFRFATQGKVFPGNCHPFPVTDKEKELWQTRIKTDVAITHNGMIPSTMGLSGTYTPYGAADECYEGLEYAQYYKYSPAGALSDTQEFIRDYLFDMGEALFNPGVLRLIEEYTGSKFAILRKGRVYYVGKFTNVNGIWYSNDSYLPPKKTVSTSTYNSPPPVKCSNPLCGKDTYSSFLVDGKVMCWDCTKKVGKSAMATYVPNWKEATP